MVTVTETTEVYRAGTDTPELIDSSATTREETDREIAHRQIVATWGQRRAALIAAYSALDTVAPQIVAANTALQAATSTGDVVAAVKQYASTNLQALGALKDAQAGVMGALGVMEEAVIWLDAALADMAEEGE